MISIRLPSIAHEESVDVLWRQLRMPIAKAPLPDTSNLLACADYLVQAMLNPELNVTYDKSEGLRRLRDAVEHEKSKSHVEAAQALSLGTIGSPEQIAERLRRYAAGVESWGNNGIARDTKHFHSFRVTVDAIRGMDVPSGVIRYFVSQLVAMGGDPDMAERFNRYASVIKELDVRQNPKKARSHYYYRLPVQEVNGLNVPSAVFGDLAGAFEAIGKKAA